MAGKEEEEEALRLKSQAEEKYKLSNLKSALKYAKRAERLYPDLDGISEMVTAFKILRIASKSSGDASPPDWYKILQVDPFSHINSIKKQYKKLALLLHPDKNPFSASEEAFKRVSEAFRVLSDKTRRKEYDLMLRIALQSKATDTVKAADTFWTACSTCRLFHQFERRYIGHSLMCPSCRKSFVAVEVSVNESDGEARVRASARIRARVVVRSLASLEKNKARKSSVERAGIGISKLNISTSVIDTLERSRSGSRSKRAKTRDEMTLAEMQLEAKRKSQLGKMKAKEKTKEKKRGVASKSGDLEIMAVEDSDFYDFDKERMERSFKKGQVWAVYDDDDGMPRHYGLIDDVVSVNPFEVKMSWLDLQNNGDEELICWEKLGFHISCGRFKVAKQTTINSVNFFSHVNDCERVAREAYRIYPKKGSIWALYHDGDERKTSSGDKRCYDIVVFLTSYSEMHGLSMAYLEKVDGFKTVFKRQEIGCHAISWLEKNDVRLFSHQIPARKLSGMEAPDLLKDCWELDPASLPSDLLNIGWGR
ncbi:hypothetical protein HHK36_028271 [Tetracentron sinense]|uniref:J domain-containing protein n=1 Tax=Tetracentron sinense TaxID=13715 RepID=A0A834YIW6_TETSI|nr:hypothetical protein HHK36_028271 [Tetracentron sinense]